MDTKRTAELVRATMTAFALVVGLVLLAGGGMWWAVLPPLCGALWCIWQR
jgi:hypothetical protein